MDLSLQLATTKNFNGVIFDCYIEPENYNGDFWATREQIGKLLEYEYPREAIGKIHQRNKVRLDKFSAEVKLTTPSGVQTTTVYNFKGLLEICRYSNQPKADAVMDWLFEVADEIRKTGSYSINKEHSALPSGVLDGAKTILEIAGIKDNQLALALDKLYRSYTGKSALDTCGVNLLAPVKEQTLTVTEIARHFDFDKPKKGAQFINSLLEQAGYQLRTPNKLWEPTKLGEKFAVMLDTNKKHSDGSPVRFLKWNSGIITVIENLLHQ